MGDTLPIYRFWRSEDFPAQIQLGVDLSIDRREGHPLIGSKYAERDRRAGRKPAGPVGSSSSSSRLRRTTQFGLKEAYPG
ncbi:hypothetical protein CDL15_Pgr023628 [Punica granatum]|uniref:Uncharacterized protein n=1 Tax=Punica granatum TaxID=22663 RepID=A0A218W7Z1_PUNGR|nr:hypothetical protein CDL15_Pgr023628 [Punica granatum]PKI76667.1 hypothetical protein CRG98_002976 [Punica granatum]